MNKTKDYQFTIVVPVYNEEDNMEHLEERLSSFLTHASYKSCVLFVNDCSTDDSLARIEDVCGGHEDCCFLSLQRNGGLSTALKAGIDAACSQYVGYMDADLQTTPEDFNLLLEDITDYELVMGIRANRKDTPFKKLQSKIANGFRRMMTNDGVLQEGRVKQIPVRHFPRTAGVSKYNIWNRLVSPFVDCFAYRWMRKRYINYRVESDNLSVG